MVKRSGMTPTFEFRCGINGRLDLISSRHGITGEGHYFVDDRDIMESLLRSIPPEMADLMDIAVAVYLADRIARRCSPEMSAYEHQWQRDLRVIVPVRCVAKWSDPHVAGSLQKVLEFMTEDRWDLQFTSRDGAEIRPAEYTNFLFEERLDTPVVGLFSGGLDSLAGVVGDLISHPASDLVLVSANSSDRVQPIQRALVAALRRTGRRVHWAVARFGLHRRIKRAYEKEERTQRTRGFVFAATGAVVASVTRANRLHLYENGIGAINLPYTDGQLGAQNTRAMHPTAISLMEDVLRRVTGDAFEFRLVNLFRTKAEMCADLRDSPFADLATSTISCDGFPQRTPGPQQCGTCTSCLLRRQSLRVASIDDNRQDEFGYRLDVFADRTGLTAEKRFPLDVMNSQARRLTRALGSNDSWPSLIREFPSLLDLPAALQSKPRQRELAGLFSRYAKECETMQHGS